MANKQASFTGFIASSFDKDSVLVFREDIGVKRILCMPETAGFNNNIAFEVEFPEIGASLPNMIPISVFTTLGTGESAIAKFQVTEYGGQPDPDYFSINGIDENGKPTYDLPED